MIQQEGARLMLITHRTARLTEYEEARLAIEGGCRWVQLRMKGTLNLDDARRLARRLSVLCKERNTLLCIDDDVEIALASGAGGVHVGKNDMPVAEVWEHVRAAGRERDFIVGATANTFEDICANTFEDIRRAAEQGASYIGLGPFRFTQTKEKLSPVLGLEGYREILKQCREAGIHLPVYAIGGIEAADIPELMQTGITGIAISGSIVSADDPTAATCHLLKLITHNS